jgi:hypothetical protein
VKHFHKCVLIICWHRCGGDRWLKHGNTTFGHLDPYTVGVGVLRFWYRLMAIQDDIATPHFLLFLPLIHSLLTNIFTANFLRILRHEYRVLSCRPITPITCSTRAVMSRFWRTQTQGKPRAIPEPHSYLFPFGIPRHYAWVSSLLDWL